MPPVLRSVEPPPFARAAQVVIWRNTSFGPFPTTHFGHAALQLYENRERRVLISWWPGEGGASMISPAAPGSAKRRLSFDANAEMSETARAGLARPGSDRFEPIPGRQARRKKTDSMILDFRADHELARYGDDQVWEWIQREGMDWLQLPEAIVPIPGLGQVSRWGLHLPSIVDWWEEWSPDQLYKMASVTNNCAGAVKLALSAGGATWFHELPHALVYSDPVTVETYSQAVARCY